MLNDARQSFAPQPAAIDDLLQDFIRIRLLVVDESGQHSVGAIHDRERPPRSQVRTLQRMRTSTTRHRHVAGERRRLPAVVDDKIVPERLSSHCGVDRFVQQPIGRRRPDRLSQINPVVLA